LFLNRHVHACLWWLSPEQLNHRRHAFPRHAVLWVEQSQPERHPQDRASHARLMLLRASQQRHVENSWFYWGTQEKVWHGFRGYLLLWWQELTGWTLE